MKRTIYSFSGMMLFLCLCFSAKANFDGSTCFTDGFGYVWKVSYTGDAWGNYTATGTVDIGGGTLWDVVGDATIKHSTGPVHLTAINPAPDGCFFNTDSFAYFGTAYITRGVFSTSGSGTWESYCSGSVYNSGTWDAAGPCQSVAKNTNPNGPARHNSNGLKTSKNSSNTVCFNDGFYNWRITYTDNGSGAYTATGTVTVDGTPWTVYGTGAFAAHAGAVELHAVNPSPDGCFFYTDSFTYYGNAQITGSGSGTSFYGSGTWTSYCYGGVFNNGTWSAFGPCGASLKSVPYGPAKHGDAFKMNISPNPLKTSSTVTYSLVKDSKVTITVYNYMQQPVKQVVSKTESAGKHSYVIDGSSLTSGVYRVVAVVDGKSYTSSLQVVK